MREIRFYRTESGACPIEEFLDSLSGKQAREDSGLTQEEIAERLNTKKSAISRIENHAEDIKLSTLEKFASVLGRKIEVSIT